eukprot:scaffold31.g3777.t1
MDIVTIRKTETVLEAGFVSKQLGIVKGMYSMASILAAKLGNEANGHTFLAAVKIDDERYAMVAVDKNGILPNSDRIEDLKGIREAISHFYSLLNKPDIKVYAPHELSFGGEEIQLDNLLIELSRQNQLRPLFLGLSRREVFTLSAVVLALLIIGVIGKIKYDEWRQIGRQREEAANKALESINTQTGTEHTVVALVHPWTTKPTPREFLKVCQPELEKLPLSVAGWTFLEGRCNAGGLEVLYQRMVDLPITVSQFIQQASTYWPAKPSEAQPLPGQADRTPQPTWLTWTFSAQSQLAPADALTHFPENGVRLTAFSVALEDIVLNWRIEGTAYGQVPGGTIGELQDIQTATVLAKARASLAEITKKLGGPGNVVDPNASGLPAVQLIAGNARSLVATLIYPSGATYEARGGEDVPGGYRVQSITTDAVVLNRAGQVIKLGFSGSAAIEPARLDQEHLVYETRIVNYLELKALYDNDEKVENFAPQDDAKLQQEILSYIKHAIRENASDIHIIPGKHPDPNNPQNLVDSTLIRFRVYGRLITYHTIPRARGEQLISCMYMTMTDLSDKTYDPHTNQNARLAPKFAKNAGLYIGRIATGPTEDGLHCIVRLQREDGGTITTFDELGYLPEQREHLRIMMHRGYGVFFISGAVGSGKSRTLANIMKMMSQDANGEICIVTLEDPVEFRIPGAQQKPVKVTTEVSDSNDNAWLAGIDHMLRSDINQCDTDPWSPLRRRCRTERIN